MKFRRLGSLRFIILAAALLSAHSEESALFAQQITGIVSQADGHTPAGGVVVEVQYLTRDSVVARTVTGTNGSFSVRVSPHTSVRLRVVRIGYQPMMVGTYNLTDGETRVVPISLAEKRVQLSALEIASKSRCEVRPDGAQLVARLFEQARTALFQTTYTSADGIPQARFVSFTRNEDNRGKVIGPVQRSILTGPSGRPFASHSPDLLATFGYVTVDKDGSTLFAPDADVFVSESFVTLHCLSLVARNATQPQLLGIAFRPAKTRVGIVDVRGTLWIDRDTYALRFLEYSYEPLDPAMQRAAIGGRVDYGQTSSGVWFIKSWSIRMPVIDNRETTNALMGLSMMRAPIRLAGVQITGGEVEWVRLGDQILYSNTLALHAGEAQTRLVDTHVTEGIVVQTPSENSESIPAERRAAHSAAAAQSDSIAESRRMVPQRLLNPVVPTDKRQAALYITDIARQPIAFAVVEISGGKTRLSDESGRVLLRVGDALRTSVSVHRMGYSAFSGEILRDSSSNVFWVTLQGNAHTLSAINVREREKTPLQRTGFYDRMLESQRGAMVGEFLTPEHLDARHTGITAQLFTGTQYVRVESKNGKAVLRDPVRPFCLAYTIFIDGHRINNVSGDGDSGGIPLDINALVNGADVMAVEIYPYDATIPPMFSGISAARGSCGAIAFWTGARK